MGRGRDKQRIKNRNTELLRQFYHLTEAKHFSYAYAVRVLADERFFLSEARVYRIIQEGYDSFREQLASEPSTRHKNSPQPAAQLSLFKGEA